MFRSPAAVGPHEKMMFERPFHSLALRPAVLLDAARTNKRGVTIFSAFAPAISFLLASDQWRVIHNGILDTEERHFCSIRNTFHLGQ